MQENSRKLEAGIREVQEASRTTNDELLKISDVLNQQVDNIETLFNVFERKMNNSIDKLMQELDRKLQCLDERVS